MSPYVYHAEYFLVLERQVQEDVQPKEEAGEVGVDDDVPQGAQKGALLNRARDRRHFARCVCDDDDGRSRDVGLGLCARGSARARARADAL